MTDDTASSNVVGLRRVLRHMAKDKARGVVTSNPPTTAEVVNGGLAQVIKRYERAPRDAFDVFLACAEEETVYDFSSETTMEGDSFVITVKATPRRAGPTPAEGG